MHPAIVVSAYNRPQALARLLGSLAAARYPERIVIPLVISIDESPAHLETTAVAQEFNWKYGPKEVLAHPQHLGLVNHFYACGDLTQTYGVIIFLEDDLFVSPVFYFYAEQMLACYQSDPRIAGISLYSLWFNGYNQQPFVPYPDAADIFFIQVPYTQGEAFTAGQWESFRTWQDRNASHPNGFYPFHESWDRFDSQDWFPELARFMASTGRFFVYPRSSLSTGVGDAGTHFAQATGFFQAPLQSEKLIYQTKPLDELLAVYDSFFEMLPSRLNRLCDRFAGYDYCVDLYAQRSKANISSLYVLTSRACKSPIHSFAKSMWPMEANVANQLPGKEIYFCRTQDLEWSWLADLIAQEFNRWYFAHGRLPGLRSWLRGKLAGWLLSRENF